MSSSNEMSKVPGTSAYDNLGLSAKTQTQKESSDQVLGQKDFLKLMTAQMQNQDPFSPMENADFVAQMAQFSTVTGIDQVNDTLANLSDQFGQARIATAASLLGHSILVPSSIASPDENGQIHGAIDLPQSSSSVTVNFLDVDTDVLVHSIELGPTSKGIIGFSWNNVPEDLKSENQKFRIEAIANFSSGEHVIKPSIYSQVLSVFNDTENNSVGLNTSTFEDLDLSQVTKFR